MFSRRSSSQRTGRPVLRAAAATMISSGIRRFFEPNPPPTSGETRRNWRSFRPRISAIPTRMRCGPCVAMLRVSSSRRLSHIARAARPSSGMAACRFMRNSLVTVISAASRAAFISPPVTLRSIKTLSPQLSWISGSVRVVASRISVMAGNSSISSGIVCTMSSASARVGARQMAIGWPTYRTLSVAKIGKSDALNPGTRGTARIGPISGKSAALST